MDRQQLLLLALQSSIILTVISFGLTATFSDAAFLFRNPGLLLRTILAMNVGMPLVAAAIAAWSDAALAVKFALVALSLAPVPPIVQKKQVAAGGRKGYVLSLMVTMSVLSVVLIPVTLGIFNRAFDAHGDISPVAVGKIVATTVLVPILLALIVRHLFPAAEKAARPIGLVANIVLAVGVVLLLVGLWPAMQPFIGNGVVLKLALMAVAGIAIGHALGGPDGEDREVLATSTASRHPAVAIAIASAFPLAERPNEVAVILLYVIVAFVLTAVYQKWQAGRITASPPAA
ncbi:MAG: Na+-dependent transporter [Proteobacteria bacterium]|nr:Na+-dependent transporter [Pseudomonadota bacterium]